MGRRSNQRSENPLHVASNTFDPYRLATPSMGSLHPTLRIYKILLRLPVEWRRAKHLLPSPLPSAQVGGKGGRQRGNGVVATLSLCMWPAVVAQIVRSYGRQNARTSPRAFRALGLESVPGRPTFDVSPQVLKICQIDRPAQGRGRGGGPAGVPSFSW